jgi:ABC-type polysaccharide/polyol phosphate export permease
MELSTAPRIAGGGRRGLAASRLQLAAQLVRHELRKAYAGTALGRAWVFLQPALFLGVYIFLFGVLRVPKQVPGGAPAEIAVVFAGLVPWLYFARSVPNGLNSFVSHGSLVKQINFPIDVVPFVAVGTELLPFLVALAGLVALVAIEGWISAATLLLIPLTVLLTLFLIGTTAFIAPFGVMLRDLRAIVPIVMRLAIFLTPVLWVPSRLPDHFEFVAYLNPLTYFIDVTRFAAFGRDSVRLVSLPVDFAVIAGVTALMLALGFATRSYVRRVVLDYL